MNEPVHFNDRVMVWPLMEGLKGLDRTGHEATLVAGMRGWMHVDVVHGSVRRGEVELMVGKGPAELSEPDYTAVVQPKRKRGRPRKNPLQASA